MEWIHHYTTGLLLTLTLIIAIGAQNAYVLKQALKRQRTLLIISICIGSDIVVIALGAVAISWLEVILPKISNYIYFLGAVFLFGHGIFSFLAIRKDETFPNITPNDHPSAKSSLSKNTTALEQKAYRRETLGIVLTLLGVTYLNPHFYLDTFFLIGAQVSFLKGFDQVVFFLGCSSASILWFFTLGYGPRVLSPLFAKPITWKWLNFAIGVLMWILAYLFAKEVIQNF